MPAVITAKEIEDIIAKGGDPKNLPADAVLTPSAKDALRDYANARRGNASAAPAAPPPALRLQLTVEAGAVRYRRDFVRDLVVAFSFEDQAFHLREARAVLPGDFRLHRKVGFEGDETHPGYDGVIEVNGLHLRETLKWIGIDIAGVPADRLQTLRLNGRTRPVKGVVHVAGATFSLDDQAGTVTADIALAIPTVIGARLRMPQLDLDA